MRICCSVGNFIKRKPFNLIELVSIKDVMILVVTAKNIP